jgi:FMN-dependent NADH-azoreductase
LSRPTRFPGRALKPETHEGLLGDRDMIVLAARGGGSAPGTPRDGCDHAEPSLADSVPAMAGLKGLATESLAAAEREVDTLWVVVA